MSEGRAVKRPRALQDLDEAAAYIQDRSGPERAIRFLRAAESTFAMLAGMPGMGTLYQADPPLDADLRYFPVARHPNHVAFYRPLVVGIEVLRVLHEAREIAGILAEEFGVDPGREEGADDESEA